MLNMNPVLNKMAYSALQAGSEKPRQRVSNADRKVFATSSLLAEEFPDILENIQILHKISR